MIVERTLGALSPPDPLWDSETDHAIRGTPTWFPFGTPVTANLQIPILAPPVFDALPLDATAYDKRGSVPDASLLLHGYVDDRKLATQLTNPGAWVPRFSGFAGIIAPDFSIRHDDPWDRRVFAVRMSRAVGAFYSTRGIPVVPNIRWGDSRDFDFAFDGVEEGSVVAVSNHGAWRDPRLRQGFLVGLPVMIERIQPVAVYVHGTMNHQLYRQLASKTDFIHLHGDRERAHRKAA